MISTRFGLAALAASAVVCASAPPASAQSAADFYKGKRLQMLIGLSPGGGYDRYARLTARYLEKHIPGRPRIIAKNMTGGGSIVMSNYVYNAAPQDGTIIGAAQRGVPVEPLVNGKDSKVKLDPLKINWIGSLQRETSLAIAWYTSGIKSYKDLYTREFIAGGTGVTTDSVVTGHVMRHILGMKYKMIAGYPGGSEINLAMQRGEVMGRATNSWSSIKSGQFQWVKQGKLIILYQMGAKPNPDPLLKDVPFALDFAKDARTRQILFLKFAVNEFGYPYFMGPKVPKDRVAVVRAAFKAASTDPELLAQAEKRRIGVNPIYGEEMHQLLKEMYGTPQDIIVALREASKPTQAVKVMKFPIITVKGTLAKVNKKGSKLTVTGMAEGKSITKALLVSGRGTKITIGGKKAKRTALKKGMNCSVTYQGSSAKKIHC